MGLRVGVLALQGAFREHARVLRGLGAEVVEVRLPADLEDLDGLVIPGGESTTMGKLMEAYGLTAPLRAFVASRPVFGTCAGMILLSRRTVEGRQPLLGVLDVVVRRNAFGRQLHSFEAPVSIPALAGPDPFPAVFIRSPWVEEAGPSVEVLGVHEGHIVAVRQENILAAAFHPELTEDSRVHAVFLESVRGHASQGVGARAAVS
ncbi:MAG: pyridoxal 5'-phosphate synthase glutaminase subunit PdxT [Thermoleophilia bacterium]